MPPTTGRFGTGFITTHLLSRVIHLTSVYQLEREDEVLHKVFQIKLDRSFSDVESFIDEYDRVFKIFEEIDDDNKCPPI